MPPKRKPKASKANEEEPEETNEDRLSRLLEPLHLVVNQEDKHTENTRPIMDCVARLVSINRTQIANNITQSFIDAGIQEKKGFKLSDPSAEGPLSPDFLFRDAKPFRITVGQSSSGVYINVHVRMEQVRAICTAEEIRKIDRRAIKTDTEAGFQYCSLLHFSLHTKAVQGAIINVMDTDEDTDNETVAVTSDDTDRNQSHFKWILPGDPMLVCNCQINLRIENGFPFFYAQYVNQSLIEDNIVNIILGNINKLLFGINLTESKYFNMSLVAPDVQLRMAQIERFLFQSIGIPPISNTLLLPSGIDANDKPFFPERFGVIPVLVEPPHIPNDINIGGALDLLTVGELKQILRNIGAEFLSGSKLKQYFISAVSIYNTLPNDTIKYRVWCRIYGYIFRLTSLSSTQYLAAVMIHPNMRLYEDIPNYARRVEEEKQKQQLLEDEQKQQLLEDEQCSRLGAECSKSLARSAEKQEQHKLSDDILLIFYNHFVKKKFPKKYKNDKVFREAYDALESREQRDNFIEDLITQLAIEGLDYQSGNIRYNRQNIQDIQDIQFGGYIKKVSKKNIRNKKYSRKQLQKKRTSKINKNIYY